MFPESFTSAATPLPRSAHHALRCPSRRARRALGVLLLAGISLFLLSTATAAESAVSFLKFSDRLTLEALEKGDGHVSDEMLRKHAEILFTFLEGEPNSKEHRVVRNETKLRAETIDLNEVAIYVGYDNGLIRRRFLFKFRKDAGRLLSTTVVFGE